MLSICMFLYCVEVCTHLVWAGSCWKCELHNWGDAPEDNLWADSATGDFGSLEGSVTEAKFVRIVIGVNELHPGGPTPSSGRKEPSVFIIIIIIIIICNIFAAKSFVDCI